mmetsp:Transcript_76307/g.150896  ORF Transcript_76307/g.150896 Transcript_76307/m.150896 type:complete len:273 (+) Transcript_76307:44-862(+)|eukprot:CAMPEP_0172659076 /NCGR_PEP_ID=MMETSP1074-20121228/3180_1 /TAXON_ID=2916 /ORGANISM="Ceratium fusus, Strain PA161109" /LENGTH=272 /DNA_ID=CAMNT_0013474473 /DNA_START=47 /DNA_END=865 /DNA_ORIENTATION=+
MDAAQIAKIAAQWVKGMVFALGLKLSSSVDDVVWLAPFLTSNSTVAKRMQNSAVYIGICLVQTVVATCIAAAGQRAVDKIMAGNKHAWKTEKLLTVGAGILLAVYSIKLLRDYIQEQNEEAEENAKESIDDGQKADSKDEANAAEEGKSREMDSRNTLEHGDPVYQPLNQELARTTSSDASPKEVERQQTLVCIAFIGSVDDLTLFVPMLVGKEFDIVQLCLGAFIASSAIVAFCVFIGLCKPIADFLSKIPLFVIVVVFAIVLLVKGFFEN